MQSSSSFLFFFFATLLANHLMLQSFKENGVIMLMKEKRMELLKKMPSDEA